MSDKPGTIRYHMFAVWLHWILATLIIGILILGFFIMGNVPKAIRGDFYTLHKTLGVLILYFSLVRIGWRVLNPPPPMVSTLKPYEKFLARLTHFSFYVLMILMPLSGWAMVSTSRFPTKLFNAIEWPPLPFMASLAGPAKKAAHEALENGHEIGAFLIAAVLILHIAAALKHQLMDKDGTASRMIPGELKHAQAPERQGKGALALIIGFAIAFGAWIAMGNPLSSYKQPPRPAVEQPAPEQPATPQPEHDADGD